MPPPNRRGYNIRLVRRPQNADSRTTIIVCVCVCVSVGSHVTETDDDTVKMACGRAGWRGRAGGGGATDRPIRPGDYNDRQGTRREGTSGRAPIRIAAARVYCDFRLSPDHAAVRRPDRAAIYRRNGRSKRRCCRSRCTADRVTE